MFVVLASSGRSRDHTKAAHYLCGSGLLVDTFVTGTLVLDVDTMRQDLLKSISNLSKYTHVEPAVFGISGAALDMTVTKSLEAFLAFLEMV